MVMVCFTSSEESSDDEKEGSRQIRLNMKNLSDVTLSLNISA